MGVGGWGETVHLLHTFIEGIKQTIRCQVLRTALGTEEASLSTRQNHPVTESLKKLSLAQAAHTSPDWNWALLGAG